MRDVIVSLIVVYGCLSTLKNPYKGILVWSWLSYMNPHRLAYGFAYDMPFAYITAIITLCSMIFSRAMQKVPFSFIIITWLLFIAIMVVSTVLAYFPEDANLQFSKVIKIQLIIFITLLLITDMTKLNHLIWVIVLSIGYFSVKGGIFTILTGGGERVWGPPGTFIEDNNGLAVAILMTIPLMAYLFQISQQKWVKNGLLIAMPLSFFSAIGSQSRGALIAFAAVVMFFWLKSQKKARNAIILVVLSLTIFAMMPASWYKRMDTIEKYEEDGSAMGRLNAWEYAYNAANHRIFGMGFESWSPETFAMYAPNPRDVHAAHSIYFGVLGDHGWIGLSLFLLIYFLTWKSLKKTIIRTKDVEKFKQINALATMLQVSFIAYLVGGAFLSLAYFDLPWHLISISVLLTIFVDREMKTTPEPGTL